MKVQYTAPPEAEKRTIPAADGQVQKGVVHHRCLRLLRSTTFSYEGSNRHSRWELKTPHREVEPMRVSAGSNCDSRKGCELNNPRAVLAE
eukprot:397077-Rhodomonas_salina.1